MIQIIKIFIISCLLLIPTSLSAFSTKSILTTLNITYNQIYNENVIFKLKIVNGSNAYITPCSYNTFCITAGRQFINSLSIDQQAAVFGHEIGHYYISKYEGYPFMSSPHVELRADKFGVYLANRAGYYGMAICQDYKVRNWKYKGNPRYRTHPDDSQRYRNLGCRG